MNFATRILLLSFVSLWIAGSVSGADWRRGDDVQSCAISKIMHQHALGDKELQLVIRVLDTTEADRQAQLALEATIEDYTALDRKSFFGQCDPKDLPDAVIQTKKWFEERLLESGKSGDEVSAVMDKFFNKPDTREGSYTLKVKETAVDYKIREEYPKFTPEMRVIRVIKNANSLLESPAAVDDAYARRKQSASTKEALYTDFKKVLVDNGRTPVESGRGAQAALNHCQTVDVTLETEGAIKGFLYKFRQPVAARYYPELKAADGGPLIPNASREDFVQASPAVFKRDIENYRKLGTSTMRAVDASFFLEAYNTARFIEENYGVILRPRHAGIFVSAGRYGGAQVFRAVEEQAEITGLTDDEVLSDDLIKRMGLSYEADPALIRFFIDALVQTILRSLDVELKFPGASLAELPHGSVMSFVRDKESDVMKVNVNYPPSTK
ncbi:MAG: hypothetical protein HY459_02505 [Parcubacteria group bacterium]|nr:hypothetical protein [Parcubacteria group bacterium]